MEFVLRTKVHVEIDINPRQVAVRTRISIYMSTTRDIVIKILNVSAAAAPLDVDNEMTDYRKNQHIFSKTFFLNQNARDERSQKISSWT